MATMSFFENDSRSLAQWLDEYEAQKKEVEEKRLEEVSTEDDYEALPTEEKQLYSDFLENRGLLIEARMALDFVKTSTGVSYNGEQGYQCWSLMNSKEDYVHAIATLTGGFDERMGILVESTREDKTDNRHTSYANAPLMDMAISGLIEKEIGSGFIQTTTVADLVGVITDTRAQREELHISDKNIIKDTLSAVTHDTDKLHEFEFEPDPQKEAPQIVESNDGYVMNTSAPSAETDKEISEKVKGNEVVHNEAPRATTTDKSRAGGNVKLEEANDKGTEDKTPVKSKDDGDRDDR